MKKHLLYALFLGLPLLAGAQKADDVKMVISGMGADPGSLVLTTDTKITFSEGNLVVAQENASYTYALKDIENITFAAEMSAAEDVKVDLDTLKIDLTGGVITATAATDTPISYAVYSLSGHVVKTGQGQGTVVFDLNNAAKGVYVIKINDKVIKYTR